MKFSLSNARSVCDDLADSFVEALMQDLSQPEARTAIRQLIDTAGTRIIGINVNNPIVAPYWEGLLGDAQETLFDIAGAVMGNPPESIDVAAEMAKESVGIRVDSFAEKLKRKIAEKQTAAPNERILS